MRNPDNHGEKSGNEEKEGDVEVGKEGIAEEALAKVEVFVIFVVIVVGAFEWVAFVAFAAVLVVVPLGLMMGGVGIVVTIVSFVAAHCFVC